MRVEGCPSPAALSLHPWLGLSEPGGEGCHWPGWLAALQRVVWKIVLLTGNIPPMSWITEEVL